MLKFESTKSQETHKSPQKLLIGNNLNSFVSKQDIIFKTNLNPKPIENNFKDLKSKIKNSESFELLDNYDKTE